MPRIIFLTVMIAVFVSSPLLSATTDESLIEAAKAGNVKDTRTLVENGADVNATDEGGRPILVEAASQGHGIVVEILVDNGADIDAKDRSSGSTALIEAARNGHTDIVRLLLSRTIKIDVKDKNGWTALMIATGKGYTDIVRLLLDSGANVNVKEDYGWTALMVAIFCDRAYISSLLLDNGADVNARNDDGKTVLEMAQEKKSIKFVKMLKQAGVKNSLADEKINEIEKHNVEAEEYDVYSALIREMYFANRHDKNATKPDIERVVIEEETFPCQERLQMTKKFVDKNLIEDYRAKNTKPYHLIDLFILDVECVLLPSKDIQEIFNVNVDGWYEFYKKYPKSQGITTFSRVGFNADKTEALVYVSTSRGRLNGEGQYIKLSKKDGQWTIQKEIGLWVS